MVNTIINKLLKKGTVATPNKRQRNNNETIVKKVENLTLKNSQKEMQVIVARKNIKKF